MSPLRYRLKWAPAAWRDLVALRAYDRVRILAAIDAHLEHAPDTVAGPVKYLETVVPPWSTEPGCWQLTVVPFRVFYDVLTEGQIVHIAAIRKKPHGKSTEAIL